MHNKSMKNQNNNLNNNLNNSENTMTINNNDNDNNNNSENTMPTWLPQKFWDNNAKQVRVEDLAQSYKLLEKKLSSNNSSPQKTPTDNNTNDANDANDANLNQQQITQNDPANNPPNDAPNNPQNEQAHQQAINAAIEELYQSFQHNAAEETLAQAFGGQDQWLKLQPRLAAWGKQNLPEKAYHSLSTSVEGVKALHRLMQSHENEPPLITGGSTPVALNETRLRKMMQDPRYWRERNPEFINRVLRGFQQLYDN